MFLVLPNVPGVTPCSWCYPMFLVLPNVGLHMFLVLPNAPGVTQCSWCYPMFLVSELFRISDVPNVPLVFLAFVMFWVFPFFLIIPMLIAYMAIRYSYGTHKSSCKQTLIKYNNPKLLWLRLGNMYLPIL